MKNYVIQCTNNNTGVVSEIKWLPPLPLIYDN